MYQEIVKFDENNSMSLENSSDIKQEFQDEYYGDNKVCVSETTIIDTINISKSELSEYVKNGEIRKYETLSLNHVKIDLPSPEVNNPVSNNVKIEDGICPSDIQIQFSHELLFCNHCHEVCQDYCTKCRVLVHILNKRPFHNTYNKERELPNDVLEMRESVGQLGIFSLKVIPENVRFGPFTSLNRTGLPLRIKRGRFVVSDDKSEDLNWMQHINSARNIYDQNLFPFQYEDQLYYCSTRRIQEGEELLVYFGEKYEDNLLKNVEIDFVPITKKDVENVFACTVCCLGFSSKEYLAEHKAGAHSETKMYFVEELTQCQFCKIYLEAKEYFDYHMDYCREAHVGHCVLPTPKIYEVEVEERSAHSHDGEKQCQSSKGKFQILDKYLLKSLTKTKDLNRGKYKCESCEFKTTYKSSLGRHIEAKHLKSSDYICTECEYQTKFKANLKMHVKTKHLKLNDYKCMECEYQTNFKSSLDLHIKSKHLKLRDYKCMECDYKATQKSHLERHMKTKHIKLRNYKCVDCEYQTNLKSYLKLHIKSKHLKLRDYKCMECDYKATQKSNLERHKKTKHIKLRDFKCLECEYQTNFKSNLEGHIKRKHLKIRDFKCMECDYQTNDKSSLKIHIKTKHLKLSDFKCMECEYQTNFKSSLVNHLKAKHIKLRDYKCIECEYQTTLKSCLVNHIKTKHIKIKNLKCMECEYQTNIKSSLKIHIKRKHC